MVVTPDTIALVGSVVIATAGIFGWTYKLHRDSRSDSREDIDILRRDVLDKLSHHVHQKDEVLLRMDRR